MRKMLYAFGLIAAAGGIAGTGLAVQADDHPVYVDQGSRWTQSARSDFYTRDQGAHMIPLAWFRALRTPDGRPFLWDGLARYGYLPNPDGDDGLPVGFTTSGPAGSEYAGMNCAACHTRQINAEGQAYRIDGGPALADFQTFLTDLDAAVGHVLADGGEFDRFSVAVLGSGATPAQRADLQASLALWYKRQHALTVHALPAQPWGLGRLDAVSMIFDRLTGLDLGPAPSFLIEGNIQAADAPVRYPFLWNAAVQDKTQWPGFADNGDDILGLARNLGEVYGVFGVFEPQKVWWRPSGIDYLSGNSANFDGLTHLETLIRRIGAPKWPWAIDLTLAQQGAAIFARPTAQGGCADCHGERPGKMRFPLMQTWATPVMDTGTDSREYAVLKRTAATGVLEGASFPFVLPPIGRTDTDFNLLTVSVIGSILQNYSLFRGSAPAVLASHKAAAPHLLAALPLSPNEAQLKGAFNPPAKAAPANGFAYESRVLHGVWAAAPYLHNGSVATLADLLKPASARAASFAVGPNYDTHAIGLAAGQPDPHHVRTTTGCEARDSGNSRCGHEFGTTLSDGEKAALLEYMKTL